MVTRELKLLVVKMVDILKATEMQTAELHKDICPVSIKILVMQKEIMEIFLRDGVRFYTDNLDCQNPALTAKCREILGDFLKEKHFVYTSVRLMNQK